MSIFADWRAGMSYEELHRKYGPLGNGPWGKCECDDCERSRAQEKEQCPKCGAPSPNLCQCEEERDDGPN